MAICFLLVKICETWMKSCTTNHKNHESTIHESWFHDPWECALKKTPFWKVALPEIGDGCQGFVVLEKKMQALWLSAHVVPFVSTPTFMHIHPQLNRHLSATTVSVTQVFVKRDRNNEAHVNQRAFLVCAALFPWSFSLHKKDWDTKLLLPIFQMKEETNSFAISVSLFYLGVCLLFQSRYLSFSSSSVVSRLRCCLSVAGTFIGDKKFLPNACLISERSDICMVQCLFFCCTFLEPRHLSSNYINYGDASSFVGSGSFHKTHFADWNQLQELVKWFICLLPDKGRGYLLH